MSAKSFPNRSSFFPSLDIIDGSIAASQYRLDLIITIIFLKYFLENFTSKCFRWSYQFHLYCSIAGRHSLNYLTHIQIYHHHSIGRRIQIHNTLRLHIGLQFAQIFMYGWLIGPISYCACSLFTRMKESAGKFIFHWQNPPVSLA